MRVICTFEELDASKKLLANLITTCDKVDRAVGDLVFDMTQIEDDMSTEEVLDVLVRAYPASVRVDVAQQLVVFTYRPVDVCTILNETSELLVMFGSLIVSIYHIFAAYKSSMAKAFDRIKMASDSMLIRHV